MRFSSMNEKGLKSKVPLAFIHFTSEVEHQMCSILLNHRWNGKLWSSIEKWSCVFDRSTIIILSSCFLPNAQSKYFHLTFSDAYCCPISNEKRSIGTSSRVLTWPRCNSFIRACRNHGRAYDYEHLY